MIDILMPRLSDTMEEGAIATWHKKPGDTVSIGEILVEIETDKATMDYEAYDAGVLRDILVPEGQLATIGTVIARLDDGSPDAPAAPSAPAKDDASEVTPEPAPVPAPELTPALANRSASERHYASPLVRRLARENGIDLSAITGSGPGGRIVRADIEHIIDAAPVVTPAPASVAAPPVEPAADTDGRRSTAVPFDGARRVISRRLSESKSTVPHFTVTAAADADALLELRKTLNASLESAGRAKVSVNDLIVRAVAIALRAHPGVNASYSPDANGQTLLHGRVNIGIAVSSPAGLVVPVVQDADEKTASQVAIESKRLVGLAQEKKLGPGDMSNGTFTVSNLGMFGVEQFTAIINPPEAAILAVGAARAEPTVVAGEIVVRHRLRYTISADHRIIDGALAAQFLATLTSLIENPLTIIA
ncbi:dihydrolipoamide acetyltransferase family protein [Agromyces atrinae]|uniref:Dihydrolipoamide acetyltransferase component of pyruvate dehydrogenase complex n=1 Tax=Agromyces atrinae TaxID=592376 RepID=A0A4Q2M0M4_9MICO|nr:dihydrolipoamide acetyltransferase family protein [Agromyces atrinae]NYD66980.1 pyruvate dehydrogenase E2 component (dihydrolipoamide acetyltransferase) [Agromyces atrinae]RXZ85286.1 2-oxo acid dehydrogenase subunit E2 [Agromyces atrinae]RXZ85394.1 2-oxo acid dehydrogenase subunit E2 [Agromyces atrinae]